jgi:hypothetical protein
VAEPSRQTLMKKSPPFLLPANYPPHAPLPPGGPWIRPPSDDDWDEVTVALPVATEPSPLPPESGVHASTPLRGQPLDSPAKRCVLGLGIAPSLTPLSMVESGQVRRAKKHSA